MSLLSAIALLGVGAAAGAGAALTRARRAERARDAERAKRVVPPRPTLNPAQVLRGDDLMSIAERDARELGDELRPFLNDIARQHGAAEVSLWRHAAPGVPLTIVAWSGDGEPPLASGWGTPAERALVEWSAAEQMVGFERKADEPTVAICPVKFSSSEPAGAIVFRALDKFSTPRDAMRDWMPRHAAQVGRLVSLFTTRNEVARQSRFTRAMLRIARDLQKVTEPSKLESQLCEYACEVTGADFATLVRWDESTKRGAVSASSAQAPDELRAGDVDATSLVGTTCVGGTASFWEDARFISDRGGVLREGDPGFEAGSFAVLPMMHGHIAIGAIVIGARATGVVRALEIRNGSVLSALAVNALEAAWELEETSRRSRTDALTGLWNRRHFDEQLERILAETDRFGGSSTLVICDIDFFKKVNDTYGHDAGDAVLVKVASTLKAGVRTVDVCARLGGEELAVILPQTAAQGALELAERLRQAVEAMQVMHSGTVVRVTMSVGVATYTAGEPGKGGLFKRADERLYEAKRTGRNRVIAG